MKSKILQLKHAISLYAFLLIVWGFYRILFKIDDNIEELFVKPVIWLLPLAYIIKKEGLGLSSLGWTTKNLFKSLYIGIGLGVLFAAVGFLANATKYGGNTSFSTFGIASTSSFLFALLVSLATATSEETVFRGFIFTRVWKAVENEFAANLITTIGWIIIHLPVLIMVYELGPTDLSVRLVLTGIFGFGSAYVFARTGNIASSVLLHVLWSWPIILFR